MRWGVRDEATDDHMTTELCMTEIDNCQRLSVGPNFVVSWHHYFTGLHCKPVTNFGEQSKKLKDLYAQA